jgi:integrase/recombinase XerD
VTVIPISAGLVRFYMAYMFEEYGETDSDFLFVNLFAEPPRGADALPGRLPAGRRTAARTGIDFSPHMFRHSLATELLRQGATAPVRRQALHGGPQWRQSAP